MNPIAPLLSLAKIIQELNRANWRSLDSLLQPRQKPKPAAQHGLEAQILRQRLQLMDALLRHLQGQILDHPGEPHTPTTATKPAPLLPQDWDLTWLQITRRPGETNREQRELEQELQQLILLSLRLFKKLGLDSAQVLNDLSLKLAQHEANLYNDHADSLFQYHHSTEKSE